LGGGLRCLQAFLAILVTDWYDVLAERTDGSFPGTQIAVSENEIEKRQNQEPFVAPPQFVSASETIWIYP
jgi:hypothetical protein